MEKGANPFLNPEWLETQRRYLESLIAGEDGHAGSGGEEWRRALAQWHASIEPLIPTESRPVMDGILDRSHAFFSLYERFARMLGEIAAGEDGQEWQSTLRRHVDQMKAQFDDLTDKDVKSTALDSAWTASLEAWKQAFQFMPPDGMPDGVQGEELQTIRDRFLSLPAIGPFREQYELMQETTRLWLAYQDKCREYRRVFYRLGKEALDRLQAEILRKGEEGETINSLRELYELWIESNEAVFSHYAASEEYAVLYGDLVKAYMDFRRRSRALLEDVSRKLNLATDTDVSTLGRDQALLHEAVRDNQEEQQRLQATIEELKREIEALRNGQDQATRRDGERPDPDTGPDENGTP